MDHIYMQLTVKQFKFLNKAHAGLLPARAWYLKIDPVQIIGMRVCTCVCVCVAVPKAVND